MTNRRVNTAAVTPAYEDAGLFQGEVSTVDVALAPVIARNARGDYLVTGFVRDTLELRVLFAGRRAEEAGPVVKHLRSLLARALLLARQKGEQMPVVTSVRFPLKVTGTWRKQIFEDETGCTSHQYHLVAAHWVAQDGAGQDLSYGGPPVA